MIASWVSLSWVGWLVWFFCTMCISYSVLDELDFFLKIALHGLSSSQVTTILIILESFVREKILHFQSHIFISLALSMLSR